MNYKVLPIPTFEKQLKKLSSKYPSLKEEYLRLIEKLETHPVQGISIGKSCYKIRLSIASKGKGKRGGARVITNISIAGSIVYLLSIYDKSENENLSDAELKELLKQLPD